MQTNDMPFAPGSTQPKKRDGYFGDEELFQSVHTDGDYLIFHKPGMMPVKITAALWTPF